MPSNQRQRQNLPPARRQALQRRIETIRAARQGSNNQPNNGSSNTPNAGRAPVRPTVTGGRGPAAGGTNNNATPANPPANAPMDPRDDQYWMDIARLTFERSQGLAGLDTESVFSRASYEDATDASIRQEKRNLLSAKEAANQGGAFYSSKTANTLGEISQDAFLGRAALERNLQYEEAMRALDRSGIEGGYLIDSQQALGNSTYRTAAEEMLRPSPVAPNLNPILNGPPGAPGRGGSVGGNNNNGGGSNNERSAATQRRIDELQRQIARANPRERERLREAVRRLRG